MGWWSQKSRGYKFIASISNKAKKKILFDCPHLTNPDFENLKKGFFSKFYFTVQKNTDPAFGNSWKRFFFFYFIYLFFLFWNVCILKREKDCVLEVCTKHVTCFKCTICILHQHLRCVWCLEHLLRDNAYMRWVYIVICNCKKKKNFSRPTDPCPDKWLLDNQTIFLFLA